MKDHRDQKINTWNEIFVLPFGSHFWRRPLAVPLILVVEPIEIFHCWTPKLVLQSDCFSSSHNGLLNVSFMILRVKRRSPLIPSSSRTSKPGRGRRHLGSDVFTCFEVKNSLSRGHVWSMNTFESSVCSVLNLTNRCFCLRSFKSMALPDATRRKSPVSRLSNRKAPFMVQIQPIDDSCLFNTWVLNW